MKLTGMVLASVFALSSTCAFGHTVSHGSNVRAHTMYRVAAPLVVLRSKYRNPNGNELGWFHPTPPPAQSFNDPEGKNSGLSLP
jgi:hypothetical protein